MIESIADLGLREDEAVRLDDAALRLAALDHPVTDMAAYAKRLDDLAAQIAVAGGSAESASMRASVLREILFDGHGFTGDSDTYDDPANADLIAMLDRRRGLPVSLSILYVALARRIGWEAHVLNTPGHVLVRLGSSVAPVLIDPFHGGRELDPPAIALLLKQVLGSEARVVPEHFRPMENRGVLLRLLANQSSRAEQAGDVERATTLFTRMTTIAPESAHLWWKLARLQRQLGRTSAARASLIAMFEVTREPGLRGHIRDTLNALATE
jgi:regulator of sirC expression with transglutaminase-like and TPR domain